MVKRTPKNEHRTVQVGSASVAYTVTGAGPPLVLVHGMAGSSRWWRHNVPALARHFQVYTIDLIGFGGSKSRARFILDEAPVILGTWIQQVVTTPVALAGHSMGGLVAAHLAASQPELIDRLVLVNAAALPLGRRYVRHIWGLAGVLWYARISLLPILFVDSLRAGPYTMFGAIHQVLSADITPHLGAISMPTLIVWGRQDRLLPLAMGEQLHALIPHSQLIVIHGAGHNPMWERPRAFNKTMLEFLLKDEG